MDVNKFNVPRFIFNYVVEILKIFTNWRTLGMHKVYYSGSMIIWMHTVHINKIIITTEYWRLEITSVMNAFSYITRKSSGKKCENNGTEH